MKGVIIIIIILIILGFIFLRGDDTTEAPAPEEVPTEQPAETPADNQGAAAADAVMTEGEGEKMMDDDTAAHSSEEMAQ